MLRDIEFMREALAEAKKAFDLGEVPIGAVVVLENEIIARGHNLVETLNDATAHAEMVVLKSAAAYLGNWRLLNATLYCTLEPCSMCAGAMILSRIKRLVWAAPDLRHGADGSLVSLMRHPHPIHQVEITSGVLVDDAKLLMQDFFKMRREHGRSIRSAD